MLRNARRRATCIQRCYVRDTDALPAARTARLGHRASAPPKLPQEMRIGGVVGATEGVAVKKRRVKARALGSYPCRKFRGSVRPELRHEDSINVPENWPVRLRQIVVALPATPRDFATHPKILVNQNIAANGWIKATR